MIGFNVCFIAKRLYVLAARDLFARLATVPGNFEKKL